MPTLKRANFMLMVFAIITLVTGYIVEDGAHLIIMSAIYLTGGILANAIVKDFEALLK